MLHQFQLTLRRLITILTLLAVATLLSSCTEEEKSTSNTIHAVVSAEVKGLDPIYANDVYSNTVVQQINEGLLHYHYLKRPLELEPLLARQMPEVSEDGLTHTFKLRKGIKFQDDEAFENSEGREVTAQDFIYSWKRLADPENKSDGFWIFDGKIKGLNEWREKMGKGEADYSTPVEGLQAPDKYTLKIKLTEPYYQLHYVLAMSYTAVVPKEAVEYYGEDFINNPVGTGPFKFKDWTRGSKITLEKNPTYHKETYPTEGEKGDEKKGLLKDAGKELPFADQLVFHEITESQPRWLKFMKGDLDYVTIPKDNFDSAINNNELTKDMKEKGINLTITKEPDVTYVAFNMEDPVVGKNKALRKAMSLAYNTQSVIKKFFNGRGINAHSPIPPTLKAYDPDFKNPYAAHNIEKAKKFMKKAGYPKGKELPTLEYSTTSSSTARQMAQFFKQNMAKIGIDVKINTSSWPQFQTKIKNKKAQIWGIAWSADYPDAQNFLQLLYSENVSPGPNAANFQNKNFDKLYEKALEMPPGPERRKLYHKMRDIFVEEMPWIPGSHRLGYTVYHSWLNNFKRHSVISDIFKYLRIDTKKKAENKAKL